MSGALLSQMAKEKNIEGKDPRYLGNELDSIVLWTP